KKSGDRERIIRSVLQHAVRIDVIYGEENWRVLETILGKDNGFVEGVRWLKDISPPLGERYNFVSLQKATNLIAKLGGLSAAEQLASWWLDSSDQRLKALGLTALTSSREPMGTDDVTRRHALLSRLVRALANTDLGRDDFTQHLSQMLGAIRS